MVHAQSACSGHEAWETHREELVEKYGVIERAGTDGESPLYRINEESELVGLIESVIAVVGDRRADWIFEHRDERYDQSR